MAENMMAWVKKADQDYGLVKTEKPVPAIGDDEVLVKVLATGICGTDLGIYKGQRKVPDNLTPGHEFIGEIVALGKNVKGYQIGDRVVPSIIINCGECFHCLRGYEAQCDTMQEIGIHIDGSFAEYVACPKSTLHKVGADMDLMVGASIEPVAIGYAAVRKVRDSLAGKSVMIYGPGPIGLYITQIVKASGAASVVLAGTKEARLAIGREKYGVNTVNVREDDVEAKLREYFPLNKGKADVIFEATGVASTVNDAIKNLGPHGELILVSVYHEPAEIDLLPVLRGELSLKGSFCYTREEFEYAIEMVKAGMINFDGIVSTTKLDTLDQGFEDEISRKAIKVVAMP